MEDFVVAVENINDGKPEVFVFLSELKMMAMEAS